MNFRDVFHKVSYLQYPMMAVGLYYAFMPYVVGFDSIWENYNYFLIFTGLGISFSTFQDISKTQNKLSKSVWESPRKGKFFLYLITFSILMFLSMGMFGIYISNSEILPDAAISEILASLSMGFIVISISMLGQLKVAMEMFEYHRRDKEK